MLSTTSQTQRQSAKAPLITTMIMCFLFTVLSFSNRMRTGTIAPSYPMHRAGSGPLYGMEIASVSMLSPPTILSAAAIASANASCI